jgi:hypothetical protein
VRELHKQSPEGKREVYEQQQREAAAKKQREQEELHREIDSMLLDIDKSIN